MSERINSCMQVISSQETGPWKKPCTSTYASLIHETPSPLRREQDNPTALNHHHELTREEEREGGSERECEREKPLSQSTLMTSLLRSLRTLDKSPIRIPSSLNLQLAHLLLLLIRLTSSVQPTNMSRVLGFLGTFGEGAVWVAACRRMVFFLWGGYK